MSYALGCGPGIGKRRPDHRTWKIEISSSPFRFMADDRWLHDLLRSRVFVPEAEVFFGWCRNPLAMSFAFLFLQVHRRKSDLFRHAINVAPSSAQSQACLVFSPDGLRVWVLVRAPEGCEHNAYYLLRFLKDKLEQEVYVTSPGSRMGMSVVSSTSIRSQLSETATGNVLDTYSADEIAGRQGTEQVTSDTHFHTDHVSDLLFCAEGHFRVLSPMGRAEVCRAVEKLNAGNLARDLGLSGKNHHPDKAMNILDSWASSGFNQTLEELEYQLSSAASTQSYSELFDALHAERERVSDFALNFCSRKFDRLRC